MKKLFVSALCISVIVLLVAVDVLAAPQLALLRGQYYVVGSRSCVYAPANVGDFNENFSLVCTTPGIPCASATTRTGHYDGLLDLRGDGTGTFTYNFIQYYFQATNTNNGDTPIGAYTGRCDVSYDASATGVISVNLVSCTADGVAGAGQGQTWLNDDGGFTLGASSGGDILVMSNIGPVVEDTWRSDGAYTIKRICSRTFTGVRQAK